jgi:hypothetical protein
MKPTSELGYSFAESNPHWLYDLSIEDLNERKQKKQLFDAAHKVANFLGLPPKEIYDKRTHGTKVFSKRFNRWFAIRVAKNENNDECKNSIS